MRGWPRSPARRYVVAPLNWIGHPTRVGASASTAAPSGCTSATRACWWRWTGWSTLTPAATPRARCGGPASPPGSWPGRSHRSRPPGQRRHRRPAAQAAGLSAAAHGQVLGGRPATRPGRPVPLPQPAGQGPPGRWAAGGQRDTKKKELVGRYSNGGRDWRPAGEPERVSVHDFPDPQLGKAIPYGVYDLGRNSGWVSVGVDHDTAAFAAATLRAGGSRSAATPTRG